MCPHNHASTNGLYVKWDCFPSCPYSDTVPGPKTVLKIENLTEQSEVSVQVGDVTPRPFSLVVAVKIGGASN